jgi:shikimate dehydrogenase
MKRLGVLGWPVAHSRSPAIHNAALASLGLTGWRYQRLPVPPRLFPETTRSLALSGFLGANVTIPHKEAALALAEQSSETARSIGAANTLTFAPDGSIAAENTDAPGLIAALEASVRGQRVLILGAGGSARAAAWAMRQEGASEVSIWNRTRERGEALASELGVRFAPRPGPADVLINCTAVGLEAAEGRQSPGNGESPGNGTLERSASEDQALNQLGLTFDQVGEYSYVVDMVYRSGSTPLLAAARAHGSRTLEGLEILVAQGALSFELWTGRQAPLEVMRRAAHEQHPAR